MHGSMEAWDSGGMIWLLDSGCRILYAVNQLTHKAEKHGDQDAGMLD